MTLEDLLRMKVTTTMSTMAGDNAVEYTPDFRVAVQGEKNGGIHFIIHANGHNSNTLDFVATGNDIKLL